MTQTGDGTNKEFSAIGRYFYMHAYIRMKNINIHVHVKCINSTLPHILKAHTRLNSRLTGTTMNTSEVALTVNGLVIQRESSATLATVCDETNVERVG